MRHLVGAVAIAAALLAISAVSAARSTPPPSPPGPYPTEHYGYINVNPQYGSNMFYAIRGDPTKDRSKLPLIIWLQGGPGATSLFGDLLENGPTKLELANNTQGFALTNRTHTWTKHATMLYIDNPIGTGFSYTNDPKGFSTSDRDIATNLVAFTKGFLARHPEFKTNALWVFCESYGGKMTAYFGAALAKALKAKEFDANFKGVALGDGWVDPVGCMFSYGPYLYALSQITETEMNNVTEYAKYAQEALESGNGTEATFWWGTQQDVISYYAANVNWYNVLTNYDYTADTVLNTYLGGPFAAMLGDLVPKNFSYNAQDNDVWNYMQNSFMNDGVNQVQAMIDAGVSVNVYGGQIDLIVDTLCIQKWINKLSWPSLKQFWNAPRLPIYPPDCPNFQCNVAGFVQKFRNFAFWQVMGAGHMVPLDQPWTAEYMMTQIIGSTSEVGATHVPGRKAMHHREQSTGMMRALKRGRPAKKP